MTPDQSIKPDDQATEVPSEAQFQAAIADIVADQSMSPDEKKLRLETLRQEFIAPEHVEHDPYKTLEAQVADAITMLAEGGHLYQPIPPEDDTL